MLSKKIEEALNEQINKEMYSAYLYMSMSAHSTNAGLAGFAKGGRVKLKIIEEPLSTFTDAMDMFQKTLKHEQFITKSINELVDLAIKERDHATQIFLQWFVTEQIEEEGNDNDIIAKLKLAGDKGNALFMIDKELGARVYVSPSESTA
jgi:ferritin